MATIADTTDRQVTAGKWKSEDQDMFYSTVGRTGPEKVRVVKHYTTTMLVFGLDSSGQWDGDLDTVYYSVGNGSVSDQNGMNTLFARLGMPYYFQRQGGAHIVTLDSPQFRYPVSDKSKHGWKNNADLTYL